MFKYTTTKSQISPIDYSARSISYQDIGDVIEYIEYVSELLDIQIPNFSKFKEMSDTEKEVLLRDFKINNILD